MAAVMNKNNSVLILAIALVVAGGFGLGTSIYAWRRSRVAAAQQAPSANAKVIRFAKDAEPAPPFLLRDINGKIVSTADWKGKVVILNFWATWCPPCIDEMPSLVQMQQKLQGNGVKVLAISVDADQGAYRDFLKAHNVDLLTVRDPDQKSNNLYGTFKFPETYIIDRQGVLRRKFVGPIDWGTPEILDYLGKL